MLAGTVPIAPAFAFEAPDHRGGRFVLRDGPQPGVIVLVFYRGHWCPYCRRYLAKLAEFYPKLIERNVRLAAISPEPPATSADLARELSLPFQLLCDQAGELMSQYGTRNTFAGGRLPHPAVIVIDPAGQIRFRSIDRDFKRRTTMRAILAAVDDARG